MRGLMQDWPLLLHTIIDHAALQHGERDVVSRHPDGTLHRTNYRAIRARALRLAKRLHMDGIRRGDRVATLAWNNWRHVEAWYGISGLGAVCHTVNPRLFVDQITFIMTHAEDRMVMVDRELVGLAERLAPGLPRVERYVVLTDEADMPETRLREAVSFERWLADSDDDFEWPAFDEQTAASLCYTSGTTGQPRGVLYTHRSNVLHAMSACAAGHLGFKADDSFLVAVPMFHANAWAKIYALPMAGAKMVFSGSRLDGGSMFDLMEGEDVTMAAGVPTIWSMLIDAMRAKGRKPHALRRLAIGGSACPPDMLRTLEDEFGIDVYHAWGMTEMSPLGTQGSVKPAQRSGGSVGALKLKQGSAPFGVEMRLRDGDDAAVAWDGTSMGRLMVRGPAVASAYFRDATTALDAEGFLDTGDIATIDPNGTVTIVDRAKDLVKSGGEWVSTLAIETIALQHPGVAQAAAIGLPHSKWGERPLLLIVPAPGRTLDRDALLGHLADRLAKWWVPDAVESVSSLPLTATGKYDKVALRATFAGYRWPEPTQTREPS